MKDINITTGSVLLQKEVDLILQQIDILFDTDEDEVFGEEGYGCNFHKFLWDLKATNNDISRYTKDKITSNVEMFGWSVDVDTSILEGTENDIILVNVLISKDLTQYEKTYKIEQ